MRWIEFYCQEPRARNGVPCGRRVAIVHEGALTLSLDFVKVACRDHRTLRPLREYARQDHLLSVVPPVPRKEIAA